MGQHYTAIKRELLAEAQLGASATLLSAIRPWAKTPPQIQELWFREADRLLAALPAVGLKLVRDRGEGHG